MSRTLMSLVVLILALAQPAVAIAAEFQIIQLQRFDNLHNGSIDVDIGIGSNLRHDGEIICNVVLQGPIERGDVGRLKAAVGKQRADDFTNVPRLCLNSPGGSYNEGLDLANYLMEHGIGTAVPAGADCYSACALIFMGGSFPWKGELNRFLHTQGIVGFHAPYIPDRNDKQKTMVSEDEVRTSFSDGIRAMSAFMKLGVGNPVKRITPELMQEMMAQGPSEFFQLDTVGKAIRFRVHLYGVEKFPKLDDTGFCNACINVNYGGFERYGPGQESDLCKGLGPARRQKQAKGWRLTNDVAPRGGECSIDLEYKAEKISRWVFRSDDRTGFGDGLELAFWYLYPPNTPIASLSVLAAPEPGRTEQRPDPQKDMEQFVRKLVDFVVVQYLGHGRNDHEAQPGMYADRVDYFDKGVISRDALMADKRAYYRRWPKRTYDYIKDTLRVDNARDGLLDVSFRYMFQVAKGAEQRSGIGVARLGVAVAGDRIVIQRETGEVEKRQ